MTESDKERMFDDLELIGYSLFVDLEGSDLPDAECHHCHTLDLTTADAFFNNGLQFFYRPQWLQRHGQG